MDEFLIVYYESLSDNDKKVLNIAALTGKFTGNELFSVVQKFVPVSQKEMMMCLRAAERQGLLYTATSTELTASFDFMIYVYPSLGDCQKIFDYIEKNTGQYGSYFDDTREVYKSVRQMLFYLLFGTEQQYRATERKVEIHGQHKLYIDIVEDPQYLHVLNKISPEILNLAVDIIFEYHVRDFEPLADFESFLDGVASVMPDLKYLKEYDRRLKPAFMGDFSTVINPVLSDRSGQLKSIELALQGNHRESVVLFEKSVRFQRRTRKNLCLLDSVEASYHYIVSLMCLEPEYSMPLFRKIADATNRQYSTEIFRSVANYMLNDKNRMKHELETCASKFFDDSPLIAIHFFLAHKLCNSQALDSETHLQLVREITETAFEAGYMLIAHEAAYALNATSPDIGASLFARISAEMKYPPAMSRIRRQAEWERTLNLLLDFRPAKISDAGDATSRVVYFFQPQTPCIRLVLQTRSARGWSAGRSIPIKTFAEARINAMTSADRAVANTVENNRYGILNFTSRTFLALVGHPHVFLEDTKGGSVPMEFVAAKPQVSVIKSGSKYVLAPEAIDRSELESQIVIRKETNTRYRVLNITDSQRKIMEILLEEKIAVPKSGREKLMELLAYMSSEGIEVHSDLASDDDSVRNVEVDARIRVQLLPFGNGLKAELFCKPFGNTPPYCKPGKGGRILIHTDNDVRLQVRRDFDTEKKYEAAIMNDIQSIDTINIADGGLMTFDEPEDALYLLDVLNRHLDFCIVEWPEGERLKLKDSAEFSALSCITPNVPSPNLSINEMIKLITGN